MLAETFSSRKRKSTTATISSSNRARKNRMNIIMAGSSYRRLEQNLPSKFSCLFSTEEDSSINRPKSRVAKKSNPTAPPVEQRLHSSSSNESIPSSSGACSDVTKNINRYFDNQPLSVSTVTDAMSLLEAAENIMASELINICLEFILQNINQSNVLNVYYHLKQYSRHNADSHEDENLRNELLNNCLQIIDTYAENIIQSNDFTKLDSEMIKDIISRRTLKIASGQNLLEALDRWASYNCKCCLLLNQSEFPVLGEKVTCCHHIVSKESTQTQAPLKTITNTNANTFTQKNKDPNHKDATQTENDVHNSLDTCSSSNEVRSIVRKNNIGNRRRMSTSKKVIHGLNDILGYAIKIFD